MFKDLVKLITDDCVVLHIKGNNIFPIFKNARSSLYHYADINKCKQFRNFEICNLRKIVVYVRDPKERFISGINTVVGFKKIKDVKTFLEDVQNFDFVDKHFMPQYVWLSQLYKFYKNDIHIKDVNELYDLIPYRESPAVPAITEELRQEIEKINIRKYIEVDQLIIEKFKNKRSKLENIIGEGYDFLPKN